MAEKYNSWGFACDYLKNWWSAQPAFGANRLERMDNLRRGGYRIVLSLDPKVQEAAEKSVGARTPPAARSPTGSWSPNRAPGG
ncbi:hypothetical protein NKG94_44005 [Micromonospora sp. M12]